MPRLALWLPHRVRRAAARLRRRQGPGVRGLGAESLGADDDGVVVVAGAGRAGDLCVFDAGV